MAKYSAILGVDTPAYSRKSRMPRYTPLYVLLLVFSPLLFEGGRYLYARWMELAGTRVDAPTPIWDWVRDQSQWLSQEIHYQMPTVFHTNGMSPSVMVVTLVVLACTGAFFLRRGV